MDDVRNSSVADVDILCDRKSVELEDCRRKRTGSLPTASVLRQNKEVPGRRRRKTTQKASFSLLPSHESFDGRRDPPSLFLFLSLPSKNLFFIIALRRKANPAIHFALPLTKTSLNDD